jgi:hypothetical protein
METDKNDTARRTSADRSGRIAAPAEPTKGEEIFTRTSTLRKLWNSADLTLGTVFMLAKGGLPPAIAMAL